MNGVLLAAVGIIYTAVAVSYMSEGKGGLAISFLCYAIANYGLYVAGNK